MGQRSDTCTSCQGRELRWEKARGVADPDMAYSPLPVLRRDDPVEDPRCNLGALWRWQCGQPVPLGLALAPPLNLKRFPGDFPCLANSHPGARLRPDRSWRAIKAEKAGRAGNVGELEFV